MIDQQATTTALLRQWDSIDEVLARLDPAEWLTPTALPGWTVHDVAAHVIGTESMLLGDEPPKVHVEVHGPHVRNEIGAYNEQWVEGLRGRTPDQMLDLYRDVTGRRRTILAELTPEQWEAPSWSPVGQTTYARFMRIRLFDCWMHDLDIRDAVAVPGDEGDERARLAFAEIADSLGYIVGKRGKAPEGSRITIELTGPLAHSVHVVVDGRARVVAALDAPATATLTLDSRLFVRLAGGRTSAEKHLDEIEFGGDHAVGEYLARHLAFTI